MAQLPLFPLWPSSKILPMVFDESMSYYEQLCALAKKLNDTIEQLNEWNIDDIKSSINTIFSQVADINNELEHIPKIDHYMVTSIETYPTVTFQNNGMENGGLVYSSANYTVNYEPASCMGNSTTSVPDTEGTYYISIPIIYKGSGSVPASFGKVKNPTESSGLYSYLSLWEVQTTINAGQIVFDPATLKQLFDTGDNSLIGYFDQLVDQFYIWRTQLAEFAVQVAKAIDDSDTAKQMATSAVQSASEALASAQSASRIAGEATQKADTAITSAGNADTKAQNALNTANTANTNASTALSTANTANTTASTALSTANTANTNANEALTKANEALSGTSLKKYMIDSLANQPMVANKRIKVITAYTGQGSITQTGSNERITIDVPTLEVNFQSNDAGGNGGLTPLGTGIHYANVALYKYGVDGTTPPSATISQNRNPENGEIAWFSFATINSPDGTTWDISSIKYLYTPDA